LLFSPIILQFKFLKKEVDFCRFPSQNMHFFAAAAAIGRNHINRSHIFVKFTKKKKIPKFCGF